VIVVSLSIPERKRLIKEFGGRRWRKLEGVALVRFLNSEIREAELHWYEARGIGRQKMKVKHVLGLKPTDMEEEKIDFAVGIANAGMRTWRSTRFIASCRMRKPLRRVAFG
jgi:hypothetical protein